MIKRTHDSPVDSIVFFVGARGIVEWGTQRGHFQNGLKRSNFSVLSIKSVANSDFLFTIPAFFDSKNMLNLHSDYNNAVTYLQMKKIYAEEVENFQNLQGSYNAGNIIIDLDFDSVMDECNSYWYRISYSSLLPGLRGWGRPEITWKQAWTENIDDIVHNGLSISVPHHATII